MEKIPIRAWDLILPECGGTSTLPQPIGDQPMGLAFPHRAGRYRPMGSPFSSQDCRRVVGMRKDL